MKASMAIAATIRSRIASGELAPGEPLPVEGALTSELGCSKPVVREALRILETEGLVEVRRGLGGGPRVRHPSISDTAKTMGIHLQIGDVPVVDVWTARDHIIASAVERLARDGVADLQPLEAEVEAVAGSIGELATYNQHMLNVGEIAVRLAGNATEHLLVAALRHIVEAQITTATSRVEGVGGVAHELAKLAESTIADAWQQTLRHIRAGRARAARQAYEEQADALRGTLQPELEGVTVDNARAAPPRPPRR